MTAAPEKAAPIPARKLYDPWTGKPVDRLSDLLPSAAGFQCDECGAEVINRCPRCGAPVCCPRCCFEDNNPSGDA